MNRLIYINGMGPNFRGDNLYEFIFSDNEDVSGEDWESSPAGGNPQPPHIDYIAKVGVLKNDKIKLNVVQNSDFFSFYDAVDKVIALSWEDIENEYYNEEDTRLVFHYGDSEQDVMSKLYERDIILTFEKNLTHV